jgi:MbtH protein
MRGDAHRSGMAGGRPKYRRQLMGRAMNDSYYVVINDEDQYSIWSADREIPRGWQAVAEPWPRAECLAYIDRVWTDIRPRSARS